MTRNRDDSLWFHGKISRHEAEQRLLEEHDNERVIDGTFLVRESNTAINNYVLSVVYDSQVIHYQIQRHGEDAFFSIDGHSPIIHGLDDLIEHYRSDASNLPTHKLTRICKGDFPPPLESLRHGRNNLLHRATKVGNVDVVSEMLKTGYRNLDAKNEEGQTAVHLACIHKVDIEILKRLIESGATVSARDIEGNSPLHYACLYKCKEMVELLINANPNLIQARNNKNGNVPLHEAAKVGSLDIVKVLLANNAPHMSRTDLGEFPIDFAKENGHTDVVEYLQNYTPNVNTFKSKWYHGTLSRDEALQLLHEKQDDLYRGMIRDNPDLFPENTYENSNQLKSELTSGTFLVRLSQRNVDKFVITLLFNNELKNYKVDKVGKYFYIDDGPYMVSLESLIYHYMLFSDGLPVNLRYNVEPKPKPPVPIPPKTPPRFLSTDTTIRKNSMPNATSTILQGNSRQSNNNNNNNNTKNTTLNAVSPTSKSKWVNSLPSMFKKKKYQTKSEFAKDEETLIPDKLMASLKDLTFSMQQKETYSSPERNTEINQLFDGTVDFFTQSDTQINNSNAKFNESNKLVEEIYFIDAPTINLNDNLNPFINDSNNNNDNNILTAQTDPELYDTQKNLIYQINESTGSNYYVAPEDLTLENESLGCGEFGNVFKGILQLRQSNTIIQVAVKTLHSEHYKQNLGEFLREASIMIKLQHDNIVKLIGIFKGPPICLVQELLPLGALSKYLTENSEKIDVKDINLWASQIALGMEYLESKRFVHRDLATRNILLASTSLAKISDFGLSRAIGIGNDVYQSQTGGRWPLKWFAPESFKYGIFSHASDVWSFGVTLWEMYSLGMSPFGDMAGSKANKLIESGQRLSKPELCSEEIYKIMLDCWNYNARLRPHFQFLASFFSGKRPCYENVVLEDKESDDQSENSSSGTTYV